MAVNYCISISFILSCHCLFSATVLSKDYRQLNLGTIYQSKLREVPDKTFVWLRFVADKSLQHCRGSRRNKINAVSEICVSFSRDYDTRLRDEWVIIIRWTWLNSLSWLIVVLYLLLTEILCPVTVLWLIIVYYVVGLKWMRKCRVFSFHCSTKLALRGWNVGTVISVNRLSWWHQTK